ncbi:MAG: hypothetical protein QOH01_3473 [Verrucomicrobiota bacterium]|jgi:hypothetical protein
MESEARAGQVIVDKIRVWIDLDVDYLEVTFSDAPGHMRPTKSGAMMKRVDEQGRIIGFSVFGVSRFQKKHPLEAGLDEQG